jgi:thioesterase domain-containing protein
MEAPVLQRIVRTPPQRYLPPFDALQDRLVQVWEQALECAPVGVWDTFAQLGGTPFAASTMVRRLEQAWGRPLPSGLITGETTIESLARSLVAQAPVAPITEIRKGTAPAPKAFTFLHGDFNGGGFYALDLARGMGDRHSVYVVAPHGFKGSEIPPSIEAMAMDQLEILSRAMPNGPYYLGGHCTSGLVAFEMARQLRRQGHDVGLVAMISSWYFDTPASGSQIRQMVPLDSGTGRPDTTSPRARAAWALSQYMVAARRYVPGEYDGRITLLWPQNEKYAFGDPVRQWARVAAEVDHCLIPGNHLTCISRHVDQLAAQLSRCLDVA